MKKFILLFLFSQISNLTSQYSLAQNSSIIFFTQGSEPFFVFLNGVKQNQNIGTNIKIFALEENKYNLLLIFPHPNFSMINNSIKITPNKESVYSIAKNTKGEYELIPKGENQLSFTPSASNQQIIKFVSHAPPAPPIPPGVGAGLNVMTGNTEQTAPNYSPPSPLPNFLPGYKGPIGCPSPMPMQEFQSAKNTINSKPFESGKITIAKQIAGTNCLFASQVKEIMALFGFEGTKIEFAKFAYSRTYDKGNYFMVNDAFEFDSSISELNKFISK